MKHHTRSILFALLPVLVWTSAHAADVDAGWDMLRAAGKDKAFWNYIPEFSINNHAFGGGDVKDLVGVIDTLSEGKYKEAMETTGGNLIPRILPWTSTLMFVADVEKVVLAVAVKEFTGELFKNNPCHEKMPGVFAEAYNGDDPYLPTCLLKHGDENADKIRPQMQAIEQKMFARWKALVGQRQIDQMLVPPWSSKVRMAFGKNIEFDTQLFQAYLRAHLNVVSRRAILDNYQDKLRRKREKIARQIALEAEDRLLEAMRAQLHVLVRGTDPKSPDNPPELDGADVFASFIGGGYAQSDVLDDANRFATFAYLLGSHVRIIAKATGYKTGTKDVFITAKVQYCEFLLEREEDLKVVVSFKHKGKRVRRAVAGRRDQSFVARVIPEDRFNPAEVDTVDWILRIPGGKRMKWTVKGPSGLAIERPIGTDWPGEKSADGRQRPYYIVPLVRNRKGELLGKGYGNFSLFPERWILVGYTPPLSTGLKSEITGWRDRLPPEFKDLSKMTLVGTGRFAGPDFFSLTRGQRIFFRPKTPWAQLPEFRLHCEGESVRCQMQQCKPELTTYEVKLDRSKEADGKIPFSVAISNDFFAPFKKKEPHPAGTVVVTGITSGAGAHQLEGYVVTADLKPGANLYVDLQDRTEAMCKAILKPDKDTAKLDVKVKDKTTGDPVVKATVRATSEGKSASGTTGDDGKVTLMLPPGETVTITATARGFKSFSGTTKLDKASGTYTVELEPEGAALVVHVQDKKSHPVAGAAVTAVWAKSSSDDVTDGRGNARVMISPDANVTVTATATGYRAGAAIVPAGSNTGTVTITLEYRDTTARDVLKVIVTNMDKKPIREVERGKRFIGMVVPSNIPVGAKIGAVEWKIVTPKGKVIPSKQARSGRSGLTIIIKSTEKWPYGEYGLIAVVHTEDQGALTGHATFTLEKESPDAGKRLKVYVTLAKSGERANKVGAGRKIVAHVLESDLPKDAKVKGVEWELTLPGGGLIRSSQPSLTWAMATQPDWPQGTCRLTAVVHTDIGDFLGEGTFVLQSEWMNVTCNGPLFTGKPAQLRLPGLPFKVEDGTKVKVKGLGEWDDPTYFPLTGRRLYFRPKRPGPQRPQFEFQYEGEVQKCVFDCEVELTVVNTKADWKHERKCRAPFAATMPDYFRPPFKAQIVRMLKVTSADSHTIKGYVQEKKLSFKATQVAVRLRDQTRAEARLVVDVTEDCDCFHPPGDVKQFVVRYMMNPQKWVDACCGRKGGPGLAEMTRKEIRVFQWLAGLKKCRHVTQRVRNLARQVAAGNAKALRELQAGQPTTATTDALGKNEDEFYDLLTTDDDQVSKFFMRPILKGKFKRK